jgi:hypothetical protein
VPLVAAGRHAGVPLPSEVAAQRAGPVPSYGSVDAIVTALDPGLFGARGSQIPPAAGERGVP